jgi:D-glycero-alpha-D-manno-heptose-7-phosphate kinase
MYLLVNKRFDHTIRVSYSKTEIVEKVDDIQHPIVREALKLVGVTSGVEVISIADVPAGTGMGSSSSFTVGLLNALYAYTGKHADAETLASQACQIEIDILGEPIGKQDQYAAAYGGLEYIRFNDDETVFVDPVICSKELKDRLSRMMMMFYTGMKRSAGEILSKQKKETKHKMETLTRMRDLAAEMRDVLIKEGDLVKFGELLHEGWVMKRGVVSDISNDAINQLYERGRNAGAIGGKLLGAGGGGFILFLVPEDKHDALREELSDLKELPIAMEPQGSKIIHVSGT